MDEALLDTDILSEVLKARDPRVLANAQQYLNQHGRLAFSAITFYEVVRGLVAARATKQLTNFLQRASNSEVIEISVPVLRRAAGLWAAATAGGHPRDDTDLIIAATAVEVGRVLVTGNKSHFDWIPGLRLKDLAPTLMRAAITLRNWRTSAQRGGRVFQALRSGAIAARAEVCEW